MTVNKATLTPLVASVENKVYDGDTETEGTISLAGAVLGQDPTSTGVFTFETADADTDKTVHVTVTLDGSWGENYALSTGELTDTASITPKTVGLAWHGYENLVYTGQPVSVTAQATGLVDGDECAVIVEGGSETAAGEHTATATGLSNKIISCPPTAPPWITPSPRRRAPPRSPWRAGPTTGRPGCSSPPRTPTAPTT